MSDNKKAREELERIYGSGSMYQRSKAEEYLSTLPRIRGVQSFVKKKHFTQKDIKKMSRILNFHHMQHVSEGGKTTLENGAVVTQLEHRCMHEEMTREEEEVVNNHIRQWKIDFLILSGIEVQEHGELVQDEETETIEIPVHNYHRKISMKQAKERRRRQEKREFNKLRKEIEDR